ncbi:hypothetical protein Plhal703r1_c22g0095301 [Plasmopara halstedii]
MYTQCFTAYITVVPRPITRGSGVPRQLTTNPLLELHCMWIPCPHAIKRKHLAEVLDELSKDD